MASTVRLEVPLDGGTLTLDYAPGDNGVVSPDVLALLARLAEMVDRSAATRARAES